VRGDLAPAAVQAAAQVVVSSRFERLIRAALTHRWTMAIKATVRDAVWTVRGSRLKNPVVTSVPRSVLFVCKGNICRSPFAAALAERMLREAGAHAVCASAGFRASSDGRSPAEAIEAARSFGIELDAHIPVSLTNAIVDEADLIVVMEASQVADMNREYPAAAGKVLLLPLAVAPSRENRGYARFNIGDPFGEPLAVFDRCYASIHEALRALVGSLVGAAGTQRDTVPRAPGSGTAKWDEKT
jgi:protein-tyrosine-phosphatase